MTKSKRALTSSRSSSSTSSETDAARTLPAAINPKSNKDIKKLIELGVQRGHLTYQEVDDLLPSELVEANLLDEIMLLLIDNEIDVITDKKAKKEKGEE